MSRAEVVLLWIGITALICAVSFPPYGYVRYTTLVIPDTGDSDDSVTQVPWIYVNHGFIFDHAPAAVIDRVEKGDGRDFILYSVKATTKIAWHVVAIEIGVIVVLALGALVTILYRTSRHASVANKDEPSVSTCVRQPPSVATCATTNR